MAARLDQVFPWGRSFDEYRAMFALDKADLGRSILGCGDGPAAFNAVMARRGGRVISADPLYRHSAGAIARRIEATFPTILAHAREYRDRYRWDAIRSVEHLGQIRRAAMAEFLDDYGRPGRRGRYVAAALPRLPFRRRAFELALCAHLLFTYSDQLSEEFHVAGALELCRVAREVRIFPLVNNYSEPSPHLAAVQAALAARGHEVEIRQVPYHFQQGGNAMLVVRRAVG